jgi:hypothetical protein
MHATLDDHALAELLPGTWSVAATNFPMWLTGERRDPTFRYETITTSPLTLADDVAYVTPEGEQKHILGVDRWHNDGFTWRGKGLLRLFASHWTVTGASEDGTVAAIHFTRSIATPAGIDILVRADVHHPELRAMIAGSTERFGLSLEDFASLSWLAPGPGSSIAT